MRLEAALIPILLAGCDPSPRDRPDPSATTFVVFAERKMVIDRLGVAVPLPVTVGSGPSPDNLQNDAPEIVTIGSGGALTAHRNGHATIRTVDGHGQLAVEVQSATAIRIEPATVRLAMGARANLRLVDQDGLELPVDAARWSTSAPGIALFRHGIVEANGAGTARVTARYGGLDAAAEIVVERRGSATGQAPIRGANGNQR